ncbi:hypothetical protein D187_001996 [Cystobacter fuscus DSM 2262]|uniref:Uncharacterized protein n=1 Tax=Cystobacter fuscus (strain ATCC 25194 / DSM 2262 / NBRC 100088 / M29) TaxID=1242864 RepID=S9QGR5_CYSF2|nr:hypothetical protein [Cystobacter fuscus]EPX60509.1 hypothetical protein D187_001996 [Cystobacter fuscus DSM 2262]
MSRLICVSREPEGLMGLVLPEEEGASRLLRVPLEQLSGPGAAERASLRASWEHLGRARGATVDTLTHVLRVLLHTVAGEPGPAPSLAHPWLESPPAPHRRTAAHPRGYRGTIHQPPKRASPEVLDVRPYLLHRATVRALLESLRPHVDEALQRLGDEGLSLERLALVRQALLAAGRAEVALAWRHGVLEERGAELPASLVRLGCLLTPGVPADFGRLLALRGRLALDTHPEVMILAARLLAEWGPEKGLGWLEVAASLVPESQTALLAALFQAKTSPFDASLYDPRIEAFASLRADWRVDYLRGLASGLSSDFLLSGLRLLDALGMSREGLPRVLPRSSGPVPEECLLDLFDFVASKLSGAYLPVCLWELCGALPGFAELLVATPWRALSAEAAWHLAYELSCLWDPGEERPREWAAIRRLHPRLLRLLERIPASHQQRAVEMVFKVLGRRGAKWSGPDWLESTTFRLVERLCGPSFATVDRFVSVLEPLLHHSLPEVRERLSRVSDRSLLRFEEGCSRGDLVGLVGEGMRLLVARHASLVLDALESCTETLVRTAQLLGTPHKEAQAALLEDFARHPWVREDPFQWPPGVLAASLREHCVDGVESPLPRKARLAWEAGEALTPVQTERALRLAATQLPRLRLQVLARGVLEFLRGNLEADVGDTRVRHALQMARLVEGGNRRGLRRLLNHYFAGERDFIVHHPESRSWFARHPRVKPETWLTGPVLCREVPGFGRVTLALERDALEVLRMGTYVGSCFGLNGLYAESAAAVALDVNKRVLYARDSRGSVLARQLLAISKDDLLVPFFVYPKSAAPALQALFLDYDLAFAEALGLPLNDGDGDPEVEFVLSSSFWHDGAWDFTTPDDEMAPPSSPEPVSHP